MPYIAIRVREKNEITVGTNVICSKRPWYFFFPLPQSVSKLLVSSAVISLELYNFWCFIRKIADKNRTDKFSELIAIRKKKKPSFSTVQLLELFLYLC